MKKTPKKKYETCLLVLDANILIKDLWWEGETFGYLNKRLFLAHTLVIPEVALREAVNSITLRASDLLKRLETSGKTARLLAQYQRIFGKEEIDDETPDALGERYKKSLLGRIRGAGGFVAETPEISLPEIVDRSIRRKKPFGGGDKGFRDTLIWLCTVELVKEYSRVSFISQNISDFSGKDRILHPELADEVGKVLPVGVVFRFFTSIDEFVVAFDGDGSATAVAFRRSLLSSGFKGFHLDRWLHRNLMRLSRDTELDGVRWAGVPYWAEDPRLIKVNRLVGVDVDETIKVEGNEAIFDTDIAIVGIFQCSILYANWESVVHSSQVVWHEEEYDDAWTEVGIETVATFTCRLRFDLDSAKVKKCWLVPLQHNYVEARETLDQVLEIERQIEDNNTGAS